MALAIFLGLVVASVYLFPPKKALAAYLGYIADISVLFAGFWLKGEPTAMALGLAFSAAGQWDG